MIASQDSDLHNSQFDLTVTCTDIMSTSTAPSASTTATVTFSNPCFDTTILQEPLPQTTYEANLFTPVFFPLPEATSTEDCGSVSYYLNGLPEPDPYEIVLLNGQLGFWVNLNDASQTGTFPWSFESCISIDGVEKAVCNTQDNLTMNAVNTCPTTQIIPQTLSMTTLSVYQGLTNVDATFVKWIWDDTIGYPADTSYGTGLCGSKSYTVYDQNGNEVDWATVLPDGTLKLQPGLDTIAGDYSLTIVVTMDDYTDEFGDPIAAQTIFLSTVVKCSPTINLAFSDINDVFYHRWDDTTESLRTFYSFEYNAACTLEFTYEAKIMVDANTVADLPFPEIVFEPDNNKFIIQKCNPNNANNA